MCKEKCTVHPGGGQVHRGVLNGKPEGTVHSQHLLNGIAKCGTCGAGLVDMSKGRGARSRYYCSARLRGGACANGRGVLTEPLEDAVREELHGLLTEKQEVIADLMERRVAELRIEQETRAAEAEVQRLEAEAVAVDGEIRPDRHRSAWNGRGHRGVQRAARQGSRSYCRAQIEALRARPAPTFDRAAGFANARTLAATGRPLRCSTRPLRAWAVRCSVGSASSASRCGATATAGPSRAWPTSAALSGARLQSVARGAAPLPPTLTR